ncbi:MAG: UDP-N-acetylmuramoyl-L-alanine--D-glutamate ligase [Lachnospiraceae bacterium]|nr:UDP-N-acetylmuramoyl-L-alanine--D-glutamate ligase [Lachnospiraceae bacterium]
MDFKNKKILVIGGGKSGIASINLLQELGADVDFLDGNLQFNIPELLGKINKPDELGFHLGELPDELIGDYDLGVVSPGVPLDVPMIKNLVSGGMFIIGEIELGYLVGKGRVCGITGTNGKTTTTTLVGEILRAKFDDARVVGNIGIPYANNALGSTDETVYAAELSSFQLETIATFHPVCSAILNITPDHLNRHHTMENYIEAKEKVCLNQTKDDVCVLNYEDEVLREFGEKECPCKVLYFSSKRMIKDGYFLSDDVIYEAVDGQYTPYIGIDEVNLLGLHNYENIMAAIALTKAMGVDDETIKHVLRVFTAVEHRIEYTCTKRGIDFYNDSKATNTDAAIQGIRAMIKPTHLIGGGYDKHCSFLPWLEAFDGKVKELVLIGQTREQIKEEALSIGFKNVVFAESLEEAMDICYKNAVEGDAVLLSPACASWGMFDNFEQRGEMFKEYARNLSE